MNPKYEYAITGTVAGMFLGWVGGFFLYYSYAMTLEVIPFSVVLLGIIGTLFAYFHKSEELEEQKLLEEIDKGQG